MLAWTKEETALVVQLFKEGISASKLRAFFPERSRNSIIGKLHRYAISQGHKPAPRPQKLWRNNNHVTKTHNNNTSWLRRLENSKLPKVAVPSIIREVLNVTQPEARMIPLTELQPDECKWPYGNDRGQYVFCGHKQIKNSSYCAFHQQRSIPEWSRKCAMPSTE